MPYLTPTGDDRPDCEIAEHHAVEDGDDPPWDDMHSSDRANYLAARAAEDADRGWRVGRRQPRNVYLNGRMVAVFVGPDVEANALAAVCVDVLRVAARGVEPRCGACGQTQCRCTFLPLVGAQSFPVDPPITLVAGETAVVAVDYAAKTAVKVGPGECGAQGPDNLRCQRNAGHLDRIRHASTDEVHGLTKW